MRLGRCNKKGSKGVFGICPRTCYEYINKLENEYNRKINVLITDYSDGYIAMTFLRYGHNVDCYETNNILLDGEIIDNFYTIGFKKKIINEKHQKLVNIYEKDFFKNRIEKQYDFVYSYRSLHLDKNISSNKKVKKLLSSVKVGGYVYIYYYMESEFEDLANSNQYFKPYQMKSYFDLNEWEIIYSIEGHNRVHNAHPFNNKIHYHKIGTIFAKKRNNRRKLVYRYIYSIK